MVNVSTNNFDADQGMAGGAAVTVLTKSGTNEFHGSGFFFRNQDELNANTFLNNAGGLAKPDGRRTSTAARSAVRSSSNKLFFFGGFERYCGRSAASRSPTAFPSARMRAGDFSEVAAVSPSFRLFDPATGGRAAVGPARSSRTTSSRRNRSARSGSRR